VRGLAAVGATLLAASACKDDRTSVLNIASPPGYIFRSTAGLARGVPSLTTTLETLDTTAAGPPVVTAAAPRLVVRLTALKALLPGKSYRLWLADSSGTVFRLARGQVYRTRTDTAATGTITVTVDSSFTGLMQIPGLGRNNVTYRLKLRKGLMGANIRSDSAPFSQVLITIGDSSGTDTTSGAGAPIFGRRNRNNGTALATVVGSAALGNYSPLTVANAYTFSAVGSGFGEARDSELTIDFTELARPPMGYAYRAWLVNPDSSSVLIGGLTAPYPRRDVSFDPADSSQLGDPAVTPIAFFRANARNFGGQMGLVPDATGGGWFKNAVLFYLTLEPKLSDLTARGPTLINSSTLPATIFHP
jgi:hypothetical protein